MRLFLARHGESVWNSVRRFQGATDVALSDLGRAQAAALGHALRGRRLTAAYVSPMRRAAATAEIALAEAGIPVLAMEELRELSLGQWEGCTVDEIRKQAGDPYRQWLAAPLDCPPPGAEPLGDVCDRVVRAVDRIVAAHPNGDEVLVVAHGGVISVYACYLLGCSFNSLWRLRIDNASLTTVLPPRLVTINDTSHLTGELAPKHLTRAETVSSGARDRAAVGSPGREPRDPTPGGGGSRSGDPTAPPRQRP